MTVEPWGDMNSAQRYPARDLRREDVPVGPGVYAWYRNVQPVYVGKATGGEGLRQRAWGNHMGTGRGGMSGSAFRRNVAEHLGFGAAATIKADPSTLAASQVDAVNTWIRECELGWLETDAAVDLERRLKREYMPPLTKR